MYREFPASLPIFSAVASEALVCLGLFASELLLMLILKIFLKEKKKIEIPHATHILFKIKLDNASGNTSISLKSYLGEVIIFLN